jgi:D-glycero-beta-D-manno-heptose-7-phosphate kinase
LKDSNHLTDLLHRISNLSFLVVGDLYLDSYIFGQPARVSREAPIMVLEETRREHRPGGGAAPALSLATLGANVQQVGVVGQDDDGDRLLQLLNTDGVNIDGVMTDASRPTTVKTRIVAEGAFNVFPQQVSRIDRQDRSPINRSVQQQLIANIEAAAKSVDAILISDYRSGVVIAPVIDAARKSTSMSTVDSQGALRDFRGLDLIKCNQAEAELVLGTSLKDRAQRATLLQNLHAELDTRRLIVTLGGEGAAICSHEVGYREVSPPDRQQVFDVTGAGDTVIAMLTATLAAGGTDLEALYLAQLAAGIVIARWGNAQASLDDLITAIQTAGDGGLS